MHLDRIEPHSGGNNGDPNVMEVVRTWLEHPTLIREIGQPAQLQPADLFPTLRVHVYAAMTISAIVELEKGDTIRLTSLSLQLGDEAEIAIPGTVERFGMHILRLTFSRPGYSDLHDAFYFYVKDPSAIQNDQSDIAYIGTSGKLVYIPDYKGNRIADFSHAGYMGGGIQLPDVQTQMTIEPGEGDATARIQEAIDAVSQLPLTPEGLRGAVLLRRGTYHLDGTLKIAASGVVLRGEGQGEDGTLLYATGATKKNILEIGGARGVELLEDTCTTITDLYVPSGSNSFHVADARHFQVGDSVIVRRYGNDAWIHEIGMDAIVQRPITGGTKMWSPFELDFDRIIVHMEGNKITVDTPLTNSIELRWGGARVFKYKDPDRIEHVGVENMRIDVEFDPSVTDTQIDDRKGALDPYCADENHTTNFAVLNHVKNAWVRDVTGYHLDHSLVLADYGSKWVTIQDCTVLDMVSIITGGRRYSFHVCGQMILVQRAYTETARHAFVVDKWVTGPNVFLDCKSSTDYNTSEPHHRWSVGGLYDNVKAPIAIQDRIWLGSGHGWAGANYVTWNTEGELTLQQPPTAQNYAIGHVGEMKKGRAPNDYDPRPRKDGYLNALGKQVLPLSLYRQQLEDRLNT
ncbi:hypothetical protein ASG85_14505 [Paenibacillus sp. Soil724D2]|nr:hypothetical protein ASG85_14505 [Paenibacillus sp. Soil724D2]